MPSKVNGYEIYEIKILGLYQYKRINKLLTYEN